MREDLIAYALDELDDVDRQKVEELLASDPDLRAELDQIQCCLQGFEEDDCECEDMPSDLADRTTAGILSGSIVCPVGDRRVEARSELWIGPRVHVTDGYDRCHRHSHHHRQFADSSAL